jgi:hypothetical protein
LKDGITYVVKGILESKDGIQNVFYAILELKDDIQKDLKGILELKEGFWNSFLTVFYLFNSSKREIIGNKRFKTAIIKENLLIHIKVIGG